MEKNNHISQMISRAYALHQAGNFNEAESLYQTILVSDPQNPDILNLLGVIHLQRGNAFQGMKRYDDALSSYEKAIALKPDYTDAYNNRGVALHELKRYEDALVNYAKAIALKPESAEIYDNRGNSLRELKRYADALASYEQAIALKPDYARAYYNYGLILHEMKRYDDALDSYEKAIMFKPSHAIAYNNRGIILRELTRHDDALDSYTQAITLKPDYAEAYNNRGLILHEMKRYSDALVNFDKAISLNSNCAEFHDNRGNSLRELKRYADALASYEQAIVLKPDYANAYYNRGNIFRELKRYDDALVSYEKAMALGSDTPYLMGTLLHTKMHLSDWQGIDSILDALAKGLEAEKPVSSPFAILATPLSKIQQRKCAEIYVKDKVPPSALNLWNGEKYAHDRIRLGYFSSDFHNHATAYLMAELFELHDRLKFEVTGFSFGPPSSHALRKRLEKAFDHFIDVSTKSDSEIATLARNMEIGIAIDLKGFTQDSRTGIFAMRPAPVQINYLGYPGTMGANYIDYMIADSILIPEDHRCYYREKIVYLPHTYQVNDSTRQISEKRFTRQEMGLPENGFVFCCFNNSYKITPDVFDIWMRLLHKVEGSVLWLLEGNPTSSKNLRKEAESRGISNNRLIFATHIELASHLARHQLADLFLDTFNYNAHTTASDALWAGVPIVAYLGEAFAGRVAASLINAVDLPELITHSHEAYEALALKLATNPQKLSVIKYKLMQNRTMYPLFNTALFTRHIEDAYVNMWQISNAGLLPDTIYVQG